MNPKQALAQVKDAIGNRPFSYSGKWYLTFSDGKFTLQPTQAKLHAWPVIWTLSEDEIRHGLKNYVWLLIRNRIAKLIQIGSQI